MRKVILIVGVLVFLASSCNRVERNKTDEISHSDRLYFLDVIGDSALDTIVVRNNETIPCVRDIYLMRNETRSRIISIKPWRGSEFVLTQPAVEMIYLQANAIQSQMKGLRVVIRNTDFVPDCIFIDLHYNNGWVIGQTHEI